MPPKRITRDAMLAARAKALAILDGTYQAPPPVKAHTASRFMPRVVKRPRELAVRNAEGSRIGPRGRT